jgi:hypothetical protein
VNWRQLSRRDRLAVAVTAAMAVVAFVYETRYAPKSNDSGFDTEWDCRSQTHGDPTCTKKTAP